MQLKNVICSLYNYNRYTTKLHLSFFSFNLLVDLIWFQLHLELSLLFFGMFVILYLICYIKNKG